MITNNLGTNNYGFSTSSSYKLDANNPEQAILYFQQSFTNIFNNFLTPDNSSDASQGMLGGSSFDEFGSSDPFTAGYNFYSQLIDLQTQQFGTSTSVSSLELLNESANLIDKEATYSFNGQRLVGLIESVINDGGNIYFRIDGELVPIDQLLEVRKGDNNA